MQPSTTLTPETARSIAREAYTYGFPLVESYKTLYKQAIDTSHPNFKAPLNQIGRAVGIVTLDDTFVVTPPPTHPIAISGLICRSKACPRRALLTFDP